ELTVSELTQVLGQSQPRVSRHLKLLCDAGLLSRFQEGTWVFYRLADSGPGAEFARSLVARIPEDDDNLRRDLERLESVRAARAEAASKYFNRIAAEWDRVRSLYVAESEVERAMLKAVHDRDVGDLLDIGTGTGRVLQVFADRIERGLGIDLSREMLAVARANLEKRNLRHCQVRQGDVYNLPVPQGSMDVVTIHHVLHFLDDPAAAIREAARALRPGGRLLIVDFAPHQFEFLRTEYAHRRLGFTDQEIKGWCEVAGLEDIEISHLRAKGKGKKDKLTVTLWKGTQNKDAAAHYQLEVA
ncbi:MAG: methyltransferase domain-containing protein, partial [Gammaproteobacteria bacterium]|nr:methyltransferase domain-containing protein [Gammaproteobacteria bacterium]